LPPTPPFFGAEFLELEVFGNVELEQSYENRSGAAKMGAEQFQTPLSIWLLKFKFSLFLVAHMSSTLFLFFPNIAYFYKVIFLATPSKNACQIRWTLNMSLVHLYVIIFFFAN
jgi:hypothetical protein